MRDSLQLFDSCTAKWFEENLGKPTAVQQEAWPAIAEGGHVLVSAPTGTGKTLSAFLVFLDRMKEQAKAGVLKRELHLIYVSPLKSLAADIRENLKRPLEGIGGQELVTAAVRTGDTPPRERQQMIRKPPHILIITPESLYLMLTSKTGQNVLCTAKAVIIDELHALIDTKRGAHLMLSLARLDILCGKNLQRIGLSATIFPLEDAAGYLAPEPVKIVAPPMGKSLQLQVLGSYVDNRRRKKDPVWQELSELVYRYCQGNRSVIAFVEGRRYAEKLAYYVNLIGGEDFARVHHGSLSREQRGQTEQALREGRLRLLCATSSMELGIDVGEVDQVLQVGCPRTVSSTMQRLGRAGHNPGRTSVMYLFPRTAAESVLCGMTAQLAREGKVERMNPPRGCLDVLAQHLVSMAAFKSYEVDEVMKILPRAWPFAGVTRQEVKSVLEMLAGDYEHKRDIPVRPRVLYDRIHETVEGDGYSRMLAIRAGGTIPDKGLYDVRTQEGVKVGEADEEFVYETQKGDRFILGAFAWRVVNIGRDTVTVTKAQVEGARLPFWKGEIKGRDKETGICFGRMLRSFQEAEDGGKLAEKLEALGLDEAASKLSAEYLRRQIAVTGGLPDDRTIIAEHFRDQSGNSQLMIHSVFGRRINGPLALLAAQAAGRELDMEVGSVDEEDGFLLYAYGDRALPEGLLGRISPESSKAVLSALLPAAPVFNMAFRYNCGRALMMGAKGSGRHPLWMQRLRSAEMLEQVVRETEHPLIRETRRECMEQLWDVDGVRELLEKIASGQILVREIYTDSASPMSLPLQWSQEAAVMYDYSPTPGKIHAAVEEALKAEELVDPQEAELSGMQEREKLPADEKQLHSLLMREGDLAAGDLDIPVEWLESLEGQGRAVYLEQGLWIAAEQREEYESALELDCGSWEAGGADSEEPAMRKTASRERAMDIVRRMLRYRGGAGSLQVARRYGWSPETAEGILRELAERKEAVAGKEPDGREPGSSGPVYHHAELYRRAVRKTLQNRRAEIQTCPPCAYGALLASRLCPSLPAEEGIRMAAANLGGAEIPAQAVEELLLPGRVRGYRESVLDRFLSQGEYFWHMKEGGRLCFDRCDAIDWDGEPDVPWEELTEKERLLVEALLKRGASFMQALNSVLCGESPYDALLSLMEKGIVCADSFVPVRQWLGREKTKKSAARQRVGARVKALQAGRWDLVRPLRAPALQEKLDRCFDRYLVLCRETASACGLSFQEALSVLRIQEYTGQVRRGYFVEGFSGAQFIRQKDFAGVVSALANPGREIVWINAADPAQPWGKLLSHEKDRAFVNVPGTVAALCGGRPRAVFEKQGAVLRIFEQDRLEELLSLFVKEYREGRIYPQKKRIQVKEYPKEAAKLLADCGFSREVQGYALYR
ncbi:MAG: DEAD/DEAH box helicase [Lachnospiraceae bacterium]|nr:DEAD/DEAH box helicase [Lachnospiraceae bacterium]